MSASDWFEVAGWVLVGLWTFQFLAVARGVGVLRWARRTEGEEPRPAATPSDVPTVSAILPCRDEGERVAASVRSLLAQNVTGLELIVVDDRSQDETVGILAALEGSDPRLHVLRIEKLPEGWLGKCHALATGAARAHGRWLLFSDADVRHEPGVLGRALVHAERENLDLLSLIPENETPSVVVRGFLASLYIYTILALGVWAARPRKQSLLAAGAGAFILVRRSAYDAIGGHSAVRLAVVDDIGLARRIRAAGFCTAFHDSDRQLRIDYARTLIEYLRVSEKNAFALFRYRWPPIAVITMWTVATQVAAPLGLLFVNSARVPGIILWGLIAATYWLATPLVQAPPWIFVLHPLYAVWSMLALWNSMLWTWRNGGVRWRDRTYPLRELRTWHREDARRERALRRLPRRPKEPTENGG